MDEIKNDLRIPMEQPLDLVVIAVKKSALRCKIITSNESITFRKVRDEVEGEIITVKPSKVWRYKRTHYITGEIISRRLDIPGLNLKSLALTNMGPWDPKEEYWGEPDEPIDEYCKPIIDYGARESYEMEQIIPFQDPEDFDSDPIGDASDYYSCGNIADALKIMEKILTADLRCLDAHAHLGNWDFDSEYRLDKAKRHYEVGVKIGELSFNNEFNGVLSWGHIDNRPYLRCLHGYGLALWRLDKPEEAWKIFNKILWLNPRDNQGIRFLLADIDAGKNVAGMHSMKELSVWMVKLAMFTREKSELTESGEGNLHSGSTRYGVVRALIFGPAAGTFVGMLLKYLKDKGIFIP